MHPCSSSSLLFRQFCAWRLSTPVIRTARPRQRCCTYDRCANRIEIISAPHDESGWHELCSISPHRRQTAVPARQLTSTRWRASSSRQSRRTNARSRRRIERSRRSIARFLRLEYPQFAQFQRGLPATQPPSAGSLVPKHDPELRWTLSRADCASTASGHADRRAAEPTS